MSKEGRPVLRTPTTSSCRSNVPSGSQGSFDFRTSIAAAGTPMQPPVPTQTASSSMLGPSAPTPKFRRSTTIAKASVTCQSSHQSTAVSAWPVSASHNHAHQMASYSCADLPSGLPEGDSGVAAGSRISAVQRAGDVSSGWPLATGTARVCASAGRLPTTSPAASHGKGLVHVCGHVPA